MPDAYNDQQAPHQNPTRPPQKPPHTPNYPRTLRIPPNERFDRSVEFVRHDLKTLLWGKQAQILRAIKRHRRVAVRSCNGSGKTFVAATAVIWWLMAHPNEPAMVVTTAPTQHQVRDLLWREIRSLYFKNVALFPATTSLTQTSLELSPRHYATGLSTDSPERFQGFHETNILFVVDEASGVREEVYEAIEGSMTSRRARLLLIGNPTSLAGTFYKAFHQRRTQYKTIHISAFDTPNLTNVPTPVEGPSAGRGGVQHAPSSLLREGPREGRLQRRPSHPMTPGANEDRGGALRRDVNTPVVDIDAHNNPEQIGNSREAEQEPPQTGDETPVPMPCPPSFREGARGRVDAAGPKSASDARTITHKPIPGIVTPKWVAEASTTWSTNSAQYQVRVLGQFPTQADDTLIPLTSIEAALSTTPDPTPAHRARHIAPIDQHCHAELDSVSIPRAHNPTDANTPDLTQPILIGVDVARFGTDRTVICIRQGNHVIALTQHQKLNTKRTTGLVVDAINKYNPKHVRIDEIGIGAGVLDRLHELNHNQVEGINVGNRAIDPEHFFNLRSELYDNLRARFEERTIVIPNDDDLIGQLAAIRVEYTSRGQLKVEPKETMRRRSLPSPDKADALLLAFAPSPPPSNFQVHFGPVHSTQPSTLSC